MGKSGRYTLYFGPSYYTRVYPISRRAQCVKSNSPRSFLILPHFPFPDPPPPNVFDFENMHSTINIPS